MVLYFVVLFKAAIDFHKKRFKLKLQQQQKEREVKERRRLMAEAAFIVACEQIACGRQTDAAERTLVALRNSREGLVLAIHLLKADNQGQLQQVIKFQAGQLLRHALVNQWEALSITERSDLRGEVLRMLVRDANSLDRVVWMQLVATTAVAYKLDWLQAGSEGIKKELFEFLASSMELRAADGSNVPLSIQHVVALRILCALVEDFSSATASAIQQPFAFHRRCHESFETAGLRESFMLALKLLSQLSERSVELSSLNPQLSAEVVKSCLLLLENCLGWEFLCRRESRDSNPSRKEQQTFALESNASGSNSGSSKSADKILPGSSWREGLLESNLIDILFKLYIDLRSAAVANAAAGISEDAAHLTRQLLGLLASLNGDDLFANDGERAAFANKLLLSGLTVFSNPLVDLQTAAGLASATHASAADRDAHEALCNAGGAEYLGMCAFLAKLFRNFGVQVCLQIPDFSRILEMLLGISTGLLEGAATYARTTSTTGARGQHDDELEVDNSWLMEGFGHLLQVWVELAQGASPTHSQSAAYDQQVVHNISLVQKSAGELFVFYIEKRLVIARASAEYEEGETFDEEILEDPSLMEDHLQCLSLIARVDVARAADALLGSMQRCLANLERCAKQTNNDIDNAMAVRESHLVSEQLFWVVSLSAYVLADLSLGERPMIPYAVLLHSQAVCAHKPVNSTADARLHDVTVNLSFALLQLAQFESERVAASRGQDERSSPFLVEKLLAALSRWSSSYLLPESGFYLGPHARIQQGLPASLSLSFGPNESGMKVMDFLIKGSSMFLSHWGTQNAMSNEALGLLRTVVAANESSGSRSALLQLASWSELCDAQARSARDPNWQPLAGLIPENQGTLLQVILKSLSTAHGGMKGMERCRATFNLVVEPVALRLKSLTAVLVQGAKSSSDSGGKNSQIVFDDPQWMQDFERVFWMYRSLGRAADSGPLAKWCRDVMLASLNAEWVDLATAAVLYCRPGALPRGSASRESARRTLSRVLEFVSCFACEQLIATPSSQVLAVWQAGDRLVRVYQQLFIGTDGTARNPGSPEDEELLSNDILSLLCMFGAFADRDMIDFSEEDPFGDSALATSTDAAAGGAPEISAAQVVVQGVSLVFPLVTKTLLQYEKLAEQFFQVLTNLVNTYPKQAAGLPPNAFAPIIAALEFGMNDPRPHIARKSFEALRTLAEFHATEKARGLPGLGANINDSNSLFLRLLEFVISFVVFETFDSSLLGPSANAMLALLVCERQAYPALINKIVLAQEPAERQQRLGQAFSSLLQDGNLDLTLDRKARTAFQKSLLRFINLTRGFMCNR